MVRRLVTLALSSAVAACSVDDVTFTPPQPPPGDCAPEQCDGMDNDCSGTIDDNHAIGQARACAASSCVEIRDRNPASRSGRWWISPRGPRGEEPFEVYCDQATDGGGWGLVWRNHGGARSGEESNAALLARAASGAGDALVLPPQPGDLSSAIHQRMYDAYWTAPDREWIKLTSLWREPGEVVNVQHIRVAMRSVTMQAIFAVPVDRCFQATGKMHVVVNGAVDFGETDLINHYSSETYGLANIGNGVEDECGQPASNLIFDPAAAGNSLYRIDGGASTNAIRHLFSYVHSAASLDSSRCVYACWQGDLQGHYDGWVWAVR